MTRRWPDTLPGPSWPDYTVQPVPQVLRSQMEVGPDKTRRLTRARGDNVTPPYKLTDEQFWAFMTWYYDERVSAFGSDTLEEWTFIGSSRTIAFLPGPMGEPVDALVEDFSTGPHGAFVSAESVPADTTAIAWTTLHAAGRSQAVVHLRGRDDVYRGAVVNLTTGVIESTSGLTSAALVSRGGGWWRLVFEAPVGAGGTPPGMGIYPTVGGLTDYPGYTGPGAPAVSLLVAETQLRRSVPGRNLFIPAQPGGNAAGAAAGAAWFKTWLAFGGGLTDVEAKIKAEPGTKPLEGMHWEVKFVAEVRSA